MNIIQLCPETIAILFFTGLLAGFVDSIAGGGGLITLPVLLSVGLPPQAALGTNKLQGTFGTLSAAYNFIHKGEADLKKSSTGILFTFIGAAMGSFTIQLLDPGFIRHLVPVLLFIVLAYTMFSPRLGYENQEPKMAQNLFFIVFGLGLGFYDGFFGPGTGSFWTSGVCIFLGYNMIKAAGITRIMNFTSNIAALSFFIIGKNVSWTAGIWMAAGQVIGARIGSDMAIKKGAGFIRPIFMTVAALTIIRLFYKS
ncbi:Transmembrane domain-containing protein, TauE-like [Desulfonema limicola]|uniref:Probable membrane transporter protein n=1 Tax=Desulfonema limicola TaxID=45656 RepID=A0A975B6T0_9BACT|nr:TSUP family transporter [Desulfonema limicola]QTA79870.1 Transmembrane domain-containing protein, TauE-like [Desulfonema limicola]